MIHLTWTLISNIVRMKSTKQKVIETLEGHYGFKRHVRDGFGTAVAKSKEEGGEGGGGGEDCQPQERKTQVGMKVILDHIIYDWNWYW